MVSQHLNRNIVSRACFLAFTAIATSWLLFDQKIYVLAAFAIIIFIFQVVELINFLNRTNRKIAWFFDAIRNEDSTLNFPGKTGNKAMNELNSSLNKVNELIKNIKFDLQEQEQYYKTILENVSIGILTHNEKGNVFLANSAAKHLLGREHLTHINQVSQIDRKLFSAIKELQPGDLRLVNFKNKNGIIQVSLKATKFITSQKNLQLVVIQDIKNELETKELESWIKLIRVLTHEIMNTVAPITSLSQTIMGYYKNLDGKLPNEKIIANTLKGLEVINERGNGLISFVETYRKLTRLPKPDKKPIVVKQLFDNIITLINLEHIDENIQIKWEVNPENLEIAADKKQVSQVLINLLKNALEALKNRPDGMILLKGEINADGRAQISVTDNGPGIPDELMDKIFVPFFTTKESGSGIGLSLSRQIMLLHGGSLKVDSTPEKMTTVSLVF
ncbi:Histidine kinase-, DNA gyrase B-, and HSP90-like ATPase [Tangfeifania diversioriginum]|uniref:histidine kinase n=1 Tax=Tangfeifania diversioriginum TaxID=1168035 RepID=A0A1M6HS34_9BACT|nr:ATP-binding protein [Tangfeifania diversioriginum]SHJ24944.1 Histidine kinase-, DNA gyrase B-, and HSP90-like ATPase [Tangfeifania diversioriginum]